MPRIISPLDSLNAIKIILAEKQSAESKKGGCDSMKCLGWPVGVCSWSLGNDFEKIARQGSNSVHLADYACACPTTGSQYLAEVAKKQTERSLLR